MGLGRRLKERNPKIKLVEVQPSSPVHGIDGLKHMESSIVRGAGYGSQGSKTAGNAGRHLFRRRSRRGTEGRAEAQGGRNRDRSFQTARFGTSLKRTKARSQKLIEISGAHQSEPVETHEQSRQAAAAQSATKAKRFTSSR